MRHAMMLLLLLRCYATPARGAIIATYAAAVACLFDVFSRCLLLILLRYCCRHACAQHDAAAADKRQRYAYFRFTLLLSWLTMPSCRLRAACLRFAAPRIIMPVRYQLR